MSGIATAIVTSAVIGGVASNNASRRAAAAQQGASDAAALQAQIAAEQWDKYKEIYEPLERQVVQEAQNYDTPEQYQRAAGEASATVSDEFSKARERLQRTPGMDPSQANFGANMVGLDLAEAATGATAQNAARKNVTDTAYARKTAALGLGKGLDQTASSAAGSAATSLGNMATSQYNLAANQASSVGQLFSPGNLMNAGRSVSNWLGNSSVGGAGSHIANGSVQGNPDYIYDL